MIRKRGKKIDIVKFKRSLLSHKALKTLIEKNRAFGNKVKRISACRRNICPFCGSAGKEASPEIFNIKYLSCVNCGLYFADRQLPAKDISNYYKSDKSYHRLSYADKKTYQYRAREVSLPKIKFISQFLKRHQRRWLDVGSGIGDVVYNLKREGFKARGIEISDTSVAFAKKVFGIKLEKTNAASVLRREGKGGFDIISYFGVLEHMPSPFKELESAKELLAPGGILVLEVPHAKSFSVETDFRFPGSVVRQATPFLHLMLFTEAALKFIAKELRLKPLGIWFLGLDFYNLILHLGAQDPGFFDSEICKSMLAMNNEAQSIIDSQELSDEMIFVAKKTGSLI